MRFAVLLLALSLSLPAPARAQQGATQAPAPTLTKAPELIEFVQAPYPESELPKTESSLARSAEVVLSVAVSAEGTVSEAKVITSGGEAFDAAAIEAVLKFRFSPAEFDGKPAPVRLSYKYVFEPPPPPVTTGGFTGVLRDQTTGKPIVGAKVQVVDHGEAITGADGRFSFADLPAGKVQVVVTVEGLPEPLSTEEEITAGVETETSYDVTIPLAVVESEPGDDLEVVVVAPPKLDRRVVSTKVKADEARQLPGTQGDVLKVVESMPGVARSSAGSGAVVVWGAAPADTRTYVGAVRIPALYHFGGLRSVLHGDLISDIELVPGGYGAPYGRGLGGLILVDTKAPGSDGLHGSLQADLLDASAVVSGPLGKKNSAVGRKNSAVVSARKSYIAELASLVVDDSAGQYFTMPNYYDGALRFRHTVREGEWFEVGGMLSSDLQNRTSPSNNPALRSSERRKLDFQRVDVRYEKHNAEGQRLTVALWYGHDAASREMESSGIEQEQRGNSHLGGLRIDHQSRLASVLNARVGLDVELVGTKNERLGSLTSPPREGDPYVFGRAPADELSYDIWNTTLVTAAPYVELDFMPFGEKLHIVPGARLEPYVQSVSRLRPPQPGSPDLRTLDENVMVEPRLMVEYAPLEVFSLRAGGGLYRQPPLPDDLSSIFGNPLLQVGRGAHVLAGFKVQILRLLSVDATGFYTRGWDLGSRNPSTTPKVAEALVQEGLSRTMGAQVSLRKELGDDRLYGWVAYTLLKSERKDAGYTTFRLSDLDQTHVLTAIASYRLGLGFEFGLRARLATGFPRTPVEDAYFDTSRGRYEPILGERNTERIPMFFQLDARLSKTFDFETSELELYLDVQNVTNRKNAEEIAYSPDYSEQRFVVGIPILPVLGARWEF